MIDLTPAETYFLDSLLLGRSRDIFQLVIKDLWVKRVIDVEERWILLHPRDRHERLRYFFHKGENYTSYDASKKHEQFFLDYFDERDDVRFFELRNHMGLKLSYDVDAFTRDYLYPDLQEAGYCDYLFFKTKKGKEHTARFNFILQELNDRLEHYLHHDLKSLEAFLEELGSHILLLKKSSLDLLVKLKIKNSNLGGGALVRIQDNYELFTSFNEFLQNSFGRSYRGAFDGQGGDYGGGGVDDDW